MQALTTLPHQCVATHHFNRSFLLVAENKWKRYARSRESILSGIHIIIIIINNICLYLSFFN